MPKAFPSPSLGRLAQLVRAPALHAGCRGFESLSAQRDPSRIRGGSLCNKALRDSSRASRSERERGRGPMDGAERRARRPGASEHDVRERKANPIPRYARESNATAPISIPILSFDKPCAAASRSLSSHYGYSELKHGFCAIADSRSSRHHHALERPERGTGRGDRSLKVASSPPRGIRRSRRSSSVSLLCVTLSPSRQHQGLADGLKIRSKPC